MEKNNIEQPKIYEEREEEKIEKEINRFFDFLEKIIDETLNTKAYQTDEYYKIFTPERIQQIMTFINKVKEHSDSLKDGGNVRELFIALDNFLFEAQATINAKKLYKNLTDIDKNRLAERIFLTIMSMVGVKNYFTKEK